MCMLCQYDILLVDIEYRCARVFLQQVFSSFLFIVFVYSDDIACSSDDFSTLCSLIENVELDQALSDQIFTVFAPTDDAFANILDNVDASDQAFVKDLLLYHTVPARIISADDIVCDESLTMGNGKATTTQCDGDDLFQVGNGNLPDALPQITTTDIRACNGIIHVVNEVILPLDSDGNDNCETFGTAIMRFVRVWYCIVV